MPDIKTAQYKLSNGYFMPAVGLGTWKSSHDDVTKAVKEALEAGYRHIDTAFAYENEKAIGDAIKDCIDRGVLKRDELFVTTKLFSGFHRPDLVRDHFLGSLERLQLDYVDMYLIHWPSAVKVGSDTFTQDENGVIFSETDHVATWRAMEKLVDEGVLRSIGLSNFNNNQIQAMMDAGLKHPITNLQIESSPYFPNTALIKWAQNKGIVITAYSTFGSPDRPAYLKSADAKVLLDEPKIHEIAKAHDRSPGQVVLRWVVQRDCIVIPKSVSKSRIIENSQIFDFDLTPEEMNVLENGFEHFRAVGQFLERMSKDKHYPFNNTL